MLLSENKIINKLFDLMDEVVSEIEVRDYRPGDRIDLEEELLLRVRTKVKKVMNTNMSTFEIRDYLGEYLEMIISDLVGDVGEVNEAFSMGISDKMLLSENKIIDKLFDLIDEVASEIEVQDYRPEDRDDLEDELLRRVRTKVRKVMNTNMSIFELRKYLGEYLDMVMEELVGMNEEFSMGISGMLGLNQGVPESGDGVGVVAKPLARRKKNTKSLKVRGSKRK